MASSSRFREVQRTLSLKKEQTDECCCEAFRWKGALFHLSAIRIDLRRRRHWRQRRRTRVALICDRAAGRVCLDDARATTGPWLSDRSSAPWLRWTAT